MENGLARLKRNFDSCILVIIGLISTFIGIVNFSQIEGIILFSIGLICLSIAIERFYKLENIVKSIDELKKKIEFTMPAELVEGRDNIYKLAGELVEDAKSFIRATSFGREERTPENYLRIVARKLRESKEQNPIEYRIVMSSSKKDKRGNPILDEFGVSNLFRRGYVNVTWGLDVLIIDNRHLLIAFPEIGSDESLRKGILFKNRPDLVEGIRDWYDNYLWNNAEKE